MTTILVTISAAIGLGGICAAVPKILVKSSVDKADLALLIAGLTIAALAALYWLARPGCRLLPFPWGEPADKPGNGTNQQ